MAIYFLIEICEEIERISADVLKRAKAEDKIRLYDRSVTQLLEALIEYALKLDPRDFSPDVRFRFVQIRKGLEHLLPVRGKSVGVDAALLEEIGKFKDIFNAYGGEGSHVEPRTFDFIGDPEMKKIISRDYRELSLVLFPAGAWKSSVIMAGSILEAILYDVLTFDSAITTAANASLKAPCNRASKSKSKMPTDNWTLEELILVAEDIGELPSSNVKSIDQVLRDYRNFVHPRKEIRSKHECKEGQALLAKGNLDVVCDYYEQSLGSGEVQQTDRMAGGK